MPVDEWEQLRENLRRQGVAGADELGRFVSNTEHFPPSAFDERAAMPVLLEALPTLTDRRLVDAVAGHLRRPWARPAAFDALHSAFLRWAPTDPTTGWQLGDALASAASAATAHELSTLLQLCADKRFGTTRQMIVYSLRRYRKASGIAELLTELVDDPDVGLHAMSALRSVIGNAAALPILERVSSEHSGTLGDTASREVRKARKALGSGPARGA